MLRIFRTMIVIALVTAAWRCAMAEDEIRSIISLDGPWRFQPADGPDAPPKENEWAQITVPGTYQPWLPLPNKQNTTWGKDRQKIVRNCWYEREVVIPEAWQGRRIVLAFDEIDLDAIVCADGKRVGEVLRPEGRIDLSAHAAPGRHTLRVYVTTDYQGVSRGPDEDIWMHGQRAEHIRHWCDGDPEKFRPGRLGLTGSVTIRAEPFTAMQDVLIRTSVRKNEVGAAAWVHSRDGLAGGQAALRVFEDSDGRLVFEGKAPIPDLAAGESSFSFAMPWKDAVPWRVGGPHLYRAEVTLLDKAGKVVDRFPPITFGFREVWTEGREIMLNGVPFRLRAPWNHGPGTLPNWPFWQGLGCNGLEIQPNPTGWCGWGGRPILNPETLESADRLGMALLVPAPRATPIIWSFGDPKAVAAYEREVRLWVKRYGNHPSILAWLVDMNRGDWTEFLPQNIGRPFTDEEKKSRAAWLQGMDLVKASDPTRLVGAHSCGRVGEYQTGNVYLNFVPLQEREEWLSAWAEKGAQPFGAVEFGTPSALNFFKGDCPVWTEYWAMYFGDLAYADEDDEYVRYIESRKQDGGKIELTPRELYIPIRHTAYYRLQELFLRNTLRSWRTYGLNLGTHFWLFAEGLGKLDDLDTKGPRSYEWYKGAPDELHRRPPWANPIYDAIRANHQDLLAYIGGKPERFTAKDHSFYAGEKASKTIVAVWDGLGKRTLEARWRLEAEGAHISGGSLRLDLDSGNIVKQPLDLTMPNVTEKTQAELALEVYEDGKFLCRDSFQLQIYPIVKTPVETRRRWLLHDPMGDSTPVVQTLGIRATKHQPGDKLGSGDVLVIGRNALRGELRAPFSADDVAAGARVLILEQRWEPMEGLGFRAEDLYSRYAFPRCTAHPALDGIGPEDLINWRGESTLIAPGPDAERKRVKIHAPHWGSYGNVATVLPETPHVGAFRPIVEAEFDLQYSPMLEWRHGKGTVVFCQLDLTGRVGAEPPADRIGRNLVRYLDAADLPPQSKEIVYIGNDEDWQLVQSLGFAATRPEPKALASAIKPESIVAIGRDGLGMVKEALPALRKFAERGGRVLILPQTAEALAGGLLPWPIGVRQWKLARTEIDADTCPEIFRGIGPQHLTWRAFIPCCGICEVGLPEGAWCSAKGLFVHVPTGQGQWIFCQLDWRNFGDRKTKNHLRTRWRVRQVYGRILMNLGARSADEIAERLTKPCHFAEPAVVGSWQCMGPFKGPDDGVSALDTPTVIDNRPLPTDLVEVADGKKVRWRQLGARGGGKAYLTWYYPAKPGTIAYAVTHIYSSRERDAVFDLKCAEFMTFRVNGNVIADLREAIPDGRQQTVVRGRLKAGWNELCAKVTSTGKDLALWCIVSDPGDLRVSATVTPPEKAPDDLSSVESLLPEPPEKRPVSLYFEDVDPADDPYSFTPW
ncbi:MAG: sugar-binding domain-containing protein [Planctomycetota bacterium]